MDLIKTKELIKERIRFCESILKLDKLTVKQKEEFPETLYYWKEFDKLIEGGKSKHSIVEIRAKTINSIIRFTKSEIKCKEKKFRKWIKVYEGSWSDELKSMALMTQGEWIDCKTEHEKILQIFDKDMRLFRDVRIELYYWNK